MKTSSTNKRAWEIIRMLQEEKLIPKPDFQRRLIWTREDKNNFIDTVLKGYPFPEIYVADGNVDLETGAGTQLLVDGQQRITTLAQYFSGDPSLKLTIVPAYKDLSEESKKQFLQYDISVRDLGNITREQIIEIFKRINATKYELNDIEINNALYDGEIKKYAEKLAENEFFIGHNVFTARDFKRMGDLRYALTIIATMLSGYFNRDDLFVDILERYNDDFTHKNEIEERINRVFAFYDECNFDSFSRIWKKADLFTAIIEMDNIFISNETKVMPIECLERLNRFYSKVGSMQEDVVIATYYKAALQASNDKVNRIRRGYIISNIITGKPTEEIWRGLIEMGAVGDEYVIENGANEA